VSFLFDYFVVAVNKNVCDEVVDLDHMFCDHDSHDGPSVEVRVSGLEQKLHLRFVAPPASRFE
jgi:hypothetical protein